jgi:hypothetical protein
VGREQPRAARIDELGCRLEGTTADAAERSEQEVPGSGRRNRPLGLGVCVEQREFDERGDIDLSSRPGDAGGGGG